MENIKVADARIRARDIALSQLNNITAGIALAAVAGVGIFGAISQMTIPGVEASTSSAASPASSSSSATSSSSSGLQSSSGTVSSSSSPPVAVTGGS